MKHVSNYYFTGITNKWLIICWLFSQWAESSEERILVLTNWTLNSPSLNVRSWKMKNDRLTKQLAGYWWIGQVLQHFSSYQEIPPPEFENKRGTHLHDGSLLWGTGVSRQTRHTQVFQLTCRRAEVVLQELTNTDSEDVSLPCGPPCRRWGRCCRRRRTSPHSPAADTQNQEESCDWLIGVTASKHVSSAVFTQNNHHKLVSCFQNTLVDVAAAASSNIISGITPALSK